MIQIKTYPIVDQNLKHRLERIGDLINIEGPLLSVFKDNRNNSLYLFDWTDNDEMFNRWLVYKIETKTLSLFVNKSISYKRMFAAVNNYFVTDIERAQKPPFDIREIEKLPFEYYSNTDIFFDESDAKNFDKIKSVLDGLLSKNKQKNSIEAHLNNEVGYKLGIYNTFEKQPSSFALLDMKLPINSISDRISPSNLFSQK